jgi:O-antigen ligase
LILKDKDGRSMLDPWEHPHNEYLSIVYEFGFVGLTIFIMLVRDAFKRVNGNLDSSVIFASLLALLIFCTGQYPFHVVRISYICIVLLAVFYKLTDSNKFFMEDLI